MMETVSRPVEVPRTSLLGVLLDKHSMSVNDGHLIGNYDSDVRLTMAKEGLFFYRIFLSRRGCITVAIKTLASGEYKASGLSFVEDDLITRPYIECENELVESAALKFLAKVKINDVPDPVRYWLCADNI